MKELKIEYKVKLPANDKEAGLRITDIVPCCEDDGAELRYVGSCRCIHEDGYSFTYQCPTCKDVEITDSPFGRRTAGIEEPESKWKRVVPDTPVAGGEK